VNDLSNIKYIKNILFKNNIRLLKNLGQNFIINPEVCPKMVKFSGIDQETGVLEIGPGIGVLTKELIKKAKKLAVIELDKNFLPILKDNFKNFNNIKIINQDILKIDLKNLIKNEFPEMNTCVCANLPYYITTPVIMKFLEEKVPVKSMTFMIQKEAAERICAELGTRNAGAISFAVRYFSDPEILFKVPKESFFPVPKVDSCVIKLNLKEPPVKLSSEKLFFKIVKSAFEKRRKTLKNSLISGSINLPKEFIISSLKVLKISEFARPEQLLMEDFARISNELFKFCNKN